MKVEQDQRWRVCLELRDRFTEAARLVDGRTTLPQQHVEPPRARCIRWYALAVNTRVPASRTPAIRSGSSRSNERKETMVKPFFISTSGAQPNSQGGRSELNPTDIAHSSVSTSGCGPVVPGSRRVGLLRGARVGGTAVTPRMEIAGWPPRRRQRLAGRAHPQVRRAAVARREHQRASAVGGATPVEHACAPKQHCIWRDLGGLSQMW